MPLAFLSHSSADKRQAREVARILREEGIDVWIDDEQIDYGDSIPGRIREGLERADVLLVLLSENFNRSRWCRVEYDPILVREIERGETLVIPIRLDDSRCPELLAAKRFVDLRNDTSELKLLTQSLKRKGRADGATVEQMARLRNGLEELLSVERRPSRTRRPPAAEPLDLQLGPARVQSAPQLPMPTATVKPAAPRVPAPAAPRPAASYPPPAPVWDWDRYGALLVAYGAGLFVLTILVVFVLTIVGVNTDVNFNPLVVIIPGTFIAAAVHNAFTRP